MDVFLFGAGASAPLGLPVTKGFLADFKPEDNKVKLLFLTLLQFFNIKDKKELDIESVFAVLNEVADIDKGLLWFLLRENHQWKTPSINQCRPLAPNILDEIKSVSTSLIYKIKKHVFEKLAAINAKNAFDLYWDIFKDYDFDKNPLVIFTTNYDLVVESAFRTGLKLRDEWKHKGVKRIYRGFRPLDEGNVFDFERKIMESFGTVSIIKLHGSIDWRPYGDSIVLGGIDTPANPDAPFLVYPGYKGVPDREPYISLHLAFLNKLTEADRLVCIGFAFRDAYINSILHHALSVNDRLRIAAVAPEFPDDSAFFDLQKKFSDRVFLRKERVQLQDGQVKPNLNLDYLFS